MLNSKVVDLRDVVDRKVGILKEEIEIVEFVRNRAKMKVIKWGIMGIWIILTMTVLKDTKADEWLAIGLVINGAFLLEGLMDFTRKTIDMKKLKNKLNKFKRF